ncbi:MAG: WcaF family extracellular polysaccharide biosynthesis acetyltransferase [Bacteroidales bacterium]|nr:WcaF family extracellular polysaccharide biosynthesis acetyltransferase [Bacteroidales bacterium]
MKNCLTNKSVALNQFSIGTFPKGATLIKNISWYFVNALLVRASWNPFMNIKVLLLRLFGAKIGKGLVIKNDVTIKFPWKLTIGDNVWLGENCWIDNLDCVTIGNNVCISQGALLITGNHDYSKVNFPYRNAPIIVEDGAWIGAKAVVSAGVRIASHSILTVGAVCTKDTEPYMIYKGNPCVKEKERIITE